VPGFADHVDVNVFAGTPGELDAWSGPVEPVEPDEAVEAVEPEPVEPVEPGSEPAGPAPA